MACSWSCSGTPVGATAVAVAVAVGSVVGAGDVFAVVAVVAGGAGGAGGDGGDGGVVAAATATLHDILSAMNVRIIMAWPLFADSTAALQLLRYREKLHLRTGEP